MNRYIPTYYATTDLDGNRIKVSRSSLATEDALRIYVGEECAHLDVLMAVRVYEALADWLESVNAPLEAIARAGEEWSQDPNAGGEDE